MKLFTHQDVRELPCTFRELGSHSDWMEGVLKVRLGRLRPFIVPFSLTFFLSSPLLSSSRFRQMCQSIIAHKLFDYVVLAFIFSNCITVALERPKILQGSLVNLSKMFVCTRVFETPAPFCSFCAVAVCILRG